MSEGPDHMEFERARCHFFYNLCRRRKEEGAREKTGKVYSAVYAQPELMPAEGDFFLATIALLPAIIGEEEGDHWSARGFPGKKGGRGERG